MDRIHDPMRKEYIDAFVSSVGNEIGMDDVKEEDMPHMTTRFNGFQERDSCMPITVFVSSSRSNKYKPVIRGTPHDADEMDSASDNKENESYVYRLNNLSMMLGRTATDEDLEAHGMCRKKSTLLPGVCGDIYSVRTWFEHTVASKLKSGMISGDDDPLIAVIQDEPYGLRQRASETISMKINELISKHEDMVQAKRVTEADRHVDPEKMEEVIAERVDRVRKRLYYSMELPEHLNAFRECGPLNIKKSDLYDANGLRRKATYQHVQRTIDGMSARPKRKQASSSSFMVNKTLRKLQKTVTFGRHRATSSAVVGARQRHNNHSRNNINTIDDDDLEESNNQLALDRRFVNNLTRNLPVLR